MTSYSILRRRCEFSRHDFGSFKRSIDKELLKPDNWIGLGGSTHVTRQKDWDIWFDLFISDSIIDQYWGPGTDRMWSFPAHSAKIRAFLKEAVKYFAGLLKLKRIGKERVEANQRAISKTKIKIEPKDPPKILDVGSSSCIPAVTESLTNSSTLQLTDFVLLASLIGTNRYKLIHGTNVPTLAHLVESISKVYGLGQDQEIVSINVRIGTRVCNVDLEESRDWRYISRLIVENGRRAEMIIGVTKDEYEGK